MTHIKTNRGFTLTELLIVMAIILLALLLAVPAIRALTGAKSKQAAQNQISAFLSNVRSQAIGLQKVRGILFYADPGSGKTTLAMVEESADPLASGVGGDTPGITYLNIVPDQDMMMLPGGITILTLKGKTSVNADLFPNDHYLGFNIGAYSANTNPIGGVILFDSHGRVVLRNYGFRFTTHVPDPKDPTGRTYTHVITALDPIAFGNAAAGNVNSVRNWPQNTTAKLLQSQGAFVLLDREGYQGQIQAVGVTTDNPLPQSVSAWIDQNATPVFVNHYSGTLTAAE